MVRARLLHRTFCIANSFATVRPTPGRIIWCWPACWVLARSERVSYALLLSRLFSFTLDALFCGRMRGVARCWYPGSAGSYKTIMRLTFLVAPHYRSFVILNAVRIHCTEMFFDE
jgi:hypothetical protein